MVSLEVFLAVLVTSTVMCEPHQHPKNHDDSCNSNPCHHGWCQQNHDHYICHCHPGYTGRHCSDHVSHQQPHTQTPQPGSLHEVRESTTTTLRTTVAPKTPVPTVPTSSTPRQVSTSSTSAQTSAATMPKISTTSNTHVYGSLHSPMCDKFGTVSELASQQIAQNKSAAQCPSGSYTSPEAFILHNCHTSLPPFWKRGPNVVRFCSSIPLYTPIAEFRATGYVSSPHTISGVLLGCVSQPDGFKIAIQKCDTIPDIQTYVVGGPKDPSSFYVIMY